MSGRFRGLRSQRSAEPNSLLFRPPKFEGFFFTENEPKNLRRLKYARKDSEVTLTLLWFVPVSFQEIQSNLKELALDTYGRKVLIYLLCPRSPAYFHPTIVDLLKKGDENTTRYSKELSLLSIDFYCCFKFLFFPIGSSCLFSPAQNPLLTFSHSPSIVIITSSGYYWAKISI